MKQFSHVHHPYLEWEEVAHNMWGDAPDRDVFLGWAIEFTADHKQYGSYMLRVVREWPISCENALTDPFLNKRAWVGHAACALAMSCPEDIVRQAWGRLTDEQRFLANKEADRAIREWSDAYEKSIGVQDAVGSEMLF